MEERSHLELRQTAERFKPVLEHFEDVLRGQYNGPALLEPVLQVEAIYRELSELFGAEMSGPTDQQLEQTRTRFSPDALEQNTPLSRRGYINLRSAIQHLIRANEALDRCIRGVQDGIGFDNIKEEFTGAYNQIAEILHYSYLITLPER